MQRREYLTTVGAVAGATVAGCTGDDGATGTLSTRVTDQPGDISDFESCVVTISEIRIKPAGEGDDGDGEGDDEDGGDEDGTPQGTDTAGEDGGDGTDDQTAAADDEDAEDGDEDGEDGEITYEVDDVEADLVDLQDGNTALVGEHEIETGEYEYLKLGVTNVDATLADGGEADVDTPGNAPLQFKESFEVRENTRTVFTADFTPVRQGGSGSYVFQPVADGTQVEYESIEDTVTPTDAG